MTAQRLTDEQLLWYDHLAGGKCGPDGPSFTNVVRTRRVHDCEMDLEFHAIPAGSRAVVTRWSAGGKWMRAYVCADCIEKWNRGEL